MNKGVQYASDIWSLGVTSASLGRSGPSGALPEDLTAAAAEEFRMAALLRDMDMPPPGKGKLVDVRILRGELEQLRDPVVPPALIDFIMALIVVDMEKRPIAPDALKHSHLDANFESKNESL
ncbi:hypothetical protein VF21_10593 [Pseudogymnoascus sp. 05NY08]|nr:hypothetical protein VF21_10593 [Pseudogymnoascus sp. 05NY08]